MLAPFFQSSSLTTALTKYMEAGVWFVSVYNDQQKTQTISFKTDLYGKLKGGNLILSMPAVAFVLC